MHSVYRKKESCYGCTACENICPKNAIVMKADEKGFLYPEIDMDKCVDCGMCEKVCPYNCELGKTEFQQKYYAVQHKNAEVVYRSSSGGFFTALSDQILEADGVVYGAYFDEGFTVRHARACDKKMRDKFVGSKYVQSDMAGIMHALAQDLELGKTVLFIGTPCQVAGVSSYVEKKRDSAMNLLLCDFICHGTSSPLVWKDYVNYISEKYKGGMTTYLFRGKKKGWHQWYPIIMNKDRDLSEIYRRKDSYILLYQTCFINRESCYTCKYTSYNRMADVTMADFWNVGKVSSEMDDNKGTSEVLINTKKGQEWFEKCKKDIRYVECSREDVWQPHLEYPNAIPAKRDAFWNEYRSKNFDEVITKYGKGDFMTKMKNFVTPIAKKIGIYVLLGKLYRLVFVRKENTDDQ